jgi:hypothetical protein
MNGSHENLTWTSKAAAAHSGAACAPYPRTPNPYPLRTGISLLEVLISIGIVAVGLLSIASLLPVGSILAQRADVEQRKTALGINILRDFTTRGMGLIENWWQFNGTNNYQAYTNPQTNTDYYPPFVIDPRMVAAAQRAQAQGVTGRSAFHEAAFASNSLHAHPP